MSVRQGILALLSERPAQPNELRHGLERRTGQRWPINRGQIATTLERLARDGLVRQGEGDGAYGLTPTGHDELAAWWTSPVARNVPVRDELAIKLALAVSAPGVDVADVVRVQRTETLRVLRDLRRLVEQVPADPGPDDLAWSLVLDGLVFESEAELRWLDHVEGRLRRALPKDTTPRGTAPASTRPRSAAPVAEAPRSRR